MVCGDGRIRGRRSCSRRRCRCRRERSGVTVRAIWTGISRIAEGQVLNQSLVLWSESFEIFPVSCVGISTRV